MLDAHPLSAVLISMPGVGIRTATRILLEVGDGSAFKSAGHLAAYAGIAPVTHRSGTSIRGEQPARSVTQNSNARCSFRPSPHCTTPPVAPTTTANERKTETQRSPHLPRSTPMRCPVRHTQEQDPLPTTRSSSSLTETIASGPWRQRR